VNCLGVGGVPGRRVPQRGVLILSIDQTHADSLQERVTVTNPTHIYLIKLIKHSVL